MTTVNWDATIQTKATDFPANAPPKQAGCLVRIHPMDLDNNMIRLPQISTWIGRDPASDLFIDDSSISRRHAEIKLSSEGFWLLDNRSTNGTFVDEKRIERCLLENGARIRFGNHIYKFLANDCIEAQYHETVYSMMTQDGLTGALNKRYLMDTLQREFERSQRHSRPLTIMMMDIDFFKKVNDSYGHLAGDEVLQEFARRAKEVFRQDHVFARYGGEEFSLLMGEATSAEALTAAERFRQAVASQPFNTSAGPLPITVSIGVAEINHTTDTVMSQWLARADEHLYRAKKNGRNQTFVG